MSEIAIIVDMLVCEITYTSKCGYFKNPYVMFLQILSDNLNGREFVGS